MAGGDLVSRARSFGMPAQEVDGIDALAVWYAAQEAAERARAGGGPTFLHAHCVHLDGHFLGYQLHRIVQDPVRELAAMSGPLLKSGLRRKGAPLAKRGENLGVILGLVRRTYHEQQTVQRGDPLAHARPRLGLDEPELRKLEEGVAQEVQEVIQTALRPRARGERR